MDNYDGSGEYEEGFEEEYEEGMEEEYDEEDDGGDMGGAAAGGAGMPNAAMLQQLMRGQQGGQKQQKLKAVHQFGVVRNSLSELIQQRKGPLLWLGAGFFAFFQRGAVIPAVAGAVLVRWMARNNKNRRRLEVVSAAEAAALYDGKTVAELVPCIETVLQKDGSEVGTRVWQDYQRVSCLLSSLRAASEGRQEWDQALLQDVAWYKQKTGKLPGSEPTEKAVPESASELRDKLVLYHALATHLESRPDSLLTLAGQAASVVAKPLHKAERVAEGSSAWMEDSTWLKQFRITEEDIWQDIENAKRRQPPPAAAAPPGMPGGMMGLNPMALLGGMGGR